MLKAQAAAVDALALPNPSANRRLTQVAPTHGVVAAPYDYLDAARNQLIRKRVQTSQDRRACFQYLIQGVDDKSLRLICAKSAPMIVEECPSCSLRCRTGLVLPG